MFDRFRKPRLVELHIRLTARLQPVHRHELEDALVEFCREQGWGVDVVGGGTVFNKQVGEVEAADIELQVESAHLVPEVLEVLGAMLAPKGSTWSLGDEDDPKPFGTMEGLALYLNDTDLPEEVYASTSAGEVYDECTRLIQGIGRINSHLELPEETALYMYGQSFEQMRERVGGHESPRVIERLRSQIVRPFAAAASFGKQLFEELGLGFGDLTAALQIDHIIQINVVAAVNFFAQTSDYREHHRTVQHLGRVGRGELDLGAHGREVTGDNHTAFGKLTANLIAAVQGCTGARDHATCVRVEEVATLRIPNAAVWQHKNGVGLGSPIGELAQVGSGIVVGPFKAVLDFDGADVLDEGVQLRRHPAEGLPAALGHVVFQTAEVQDEGVRVAATRRTHPRISRRPEQVVCGFALNVCGRTPTFDANPHTRR